MVHDFKDHFGGWGEPTKEMLARDRLADSAVIVREQAKQVTPGDFASWYVANSALYCASRPFVEQPGFGDVSDAELVAALGQKVVEIREVALGHQRERN